jgi:glycosyltransferase involved in cell wall biosynthesis
VTATTTDAPLIAIDATTLAGDSESLPARFVGGLVRYTPEARYLLLTRPATEGALAGLTAANVTRGSVPGPGNLQVLLDRVDGRLPMHSRRQRLAEMVWDKRLRSLPAAWRPGGQAIPGAKVLLRPFVDSTLVYWSVPLVAAVHDLQHLSHPHLLTSAERARRAKAFENSRGHARRIVCTANSVREELLRSGNLAAERVVAAQPGRLLANEPAPWSQVEALLGRYQLAPRSYLLVPGPFERRLNHLLVLAASAIFVARHERPSLNIVVASSSSHPAGAPLRAAVERMGLAGTIQIIDSLSSVETRLLVQGSRAIIMPSLYETVGIALLDAMSFGRPIIWSGVDGLRELVGDAGLTFNPHRPDDLASVLERIESYAAMLDMYAARAQRRIESLQTPQQVADKYLCILREAQAKCQTSR